MTFDEDDPDGDRADFDDADWRDDSAPTASDERADTLRRGRYETATRVLAGFVRLTLEYVEANDLTDPRARRRVSRGMMQEMKRCLDDQERLVLALMTGCTEHEIAIIQGYGGSA